MPETALADSERGLPLPQYAGAGLLDIEEGCRLFYQPAVIDDTLMSYRHSYLLRPGTHA